MKKSTKDDLGVHIDAHRRLLLSDPNTHVKRRIKTNSEKRDFTVVVRHRGRLQEREVGTVQDETERTNSETALSASNADHTAIHQEVDAIDHLHHAARIHRILTAIETKIR